MSVGRRGPAGLRPGALLEREARCNPGADTRVGACALLEVLLAVTNIATVVVLYRIARRIDESVAIGHVALRIIESVVVFVGVVSLMSVVRLRKDFTSGGTDFAALSLAGHPVVAVHEWTRILGPQFCAGLADSILLGHLILVRPGASAWRW